MESIPKGDLPTILGSPSYLSSKNISSNANCFREIVPVKFKSKKYRQVLLYKRIKVELLTKETLLSLYNLSNTKAQVQILETPNFFLVQYPTKPFIAISRIDGRLYTLYTQGFTLEELQHQASILLRILNRFKLVEELKYRKLEENLRRKRG